MITNAEIEAMRTELERTLVDSCVLYAKTYARDDSAGGTFSWAAFGTVNCRLAPRQRIVASDTHAERFEERTEWIVLLPHETVLAAGNRLVSSGVTFEVTSVDDVATWRTCMRATLTRVVKP